MRRIRCFSFLLIAGILLTFPARAAAATQLRLDTGGKILSLTAYYEVLTPNVADIQVVFDGSLSDLSAAGYAGSKFDPQSRQLSVWIAASKPIDLPEVIGCASARQGTGSGDMAPLLRLKTYFLAPEGADADSPYADPFVTALMVARSGNSIGVTADYYGGVGENARELLFAGYGADGRLMTAKTRSVAFNGEPVQVSENLSGADIAYVKVFTLDSTYRPAASPVGSAVAKQPAG